MKSTSIQYSKFFTYIKPFTKLPIVRNYGSTIFTLFTISILTFFAIKPTIETILVLQKQLENENQVLQKITEKVNNLSQGQKNYDNLAQDIKDKISEAIPDDISLKSVIQSLEQTAKAHEASVAALQIQPLVVDIKDENQVGTLSEISFVFNAAGSYQNLLALLQDLKGSSRLISISDLSLSKTSDSDALIMSLTGKAYYLK